MPDAPRSSSTTRPKLFLALSCALVLVTGVYIYAARRSAPRQQYGAYAVGSVVHATRRSSLASLRTKSYVAFRSMAPDAGYGALAFVPVDAPSGPRDTTDFPCRRLYSSAGVIFCLGQTRSSPAAFVLDESLRIRQTFGFTGVPSRVRVSRDGRLASYTLFTAADSYMAAGFSTRTMIVDTASGARIADLEQFEAWKDGKKFHAIDFNYWGVTFASAPSKFYATLGTGGHTYLVEGDTSARRVTVVADGVECPSLSPDETRIAFKKAVSPRRWRPAILDLQTRVETVLPDGRDLDDQIEWLDDGYVLYAIQELSVAPARSSIWKIRADGTQPATLFIPNAASPAVVGRR